MKKTLALILAAMMVAGTASVAFAEVHFTDYGDPDKVYVEVDGDDEDDNALKLMESEKFEWGDSLYLQLDVDTTGTNRTEKEEVGRYRTKAEWSVGADLVESVDIVYKKLEADDTEYKYFVEIATKANVTTASQDLDGVVKVYRGSSNNLGDDQEFKLSVSSYKTAKYPSVKFVSTVESGKEDSQSSDYTVYPIDSKDETGKINPQVVSFEDSLGEFTIVFDDVAEFDYNLTSKQGKLYLGFDTKANKDLISKYDYAELEFVNFPGNPSFNKKGTMYLYTENADALLYAVNADGKMEAVKATYDEDREALKFETRTFATTYVISDTELEIVNDETSSSEAPAEGETTPSETVKPNPGTGR